MNGRLALASGVCVLAFSAVAWEAPVVEVHVVATNVVGTIKPLNGVNNGPNAENQAGKRGTFRAYRAAEFPYARIHDTAIFWDFAHTGDISCVFPDFEADVEDPSSYDFELTDHLLKRVRLAGAEPFYRLGQSIEHWKKKYGVKVPKDYRKWAQICEHVIRHYTEGWADGYRWNIEHWEIWNEADLYWPGYVCSTWTGDDEQFFEFYKVVAKHLKSKFPHLKIGGPAAALTRKSSMDWVRRFLKEMRAADVPIDFFSWHQYACTLDRIPSLAAEIREALDSNGYENVESIVTEWNYNRNFGDQYWYTLEQCSREERAAAFIAATMCAAQNAPISKMMLYETSPVSNLNSLFEPRTRTPAKGYWSFIAWNALRKLGAQVETAPVSDPEFRVCAARDPKTGRTAVLVARYRNNDAEMRMKTAMVSVDGVGLGAGASLKYLDSCWNFQTMPAEINKGRIRVFMEPNSIALVEMPVER